MAFVIIQHLDPKHPSMLADILSRETPMTVREVVSDMRVEPDHVYVIPPNRTAPDPASRKRPVRPDIDKIKRSEERLERSLGYADAVIETVREPLLVLDSALRVLRANRSFYGLFGGSPDDTLLRSIFEFNGGRWDVADLRKELETVLSEERGFQGLEITQAFDRAGERTLILNARLITPVGEQGPLILLAIEDVTERKLAEEHLRQAQKMEAVGQLAGGIAHDFNNLLNIISAHASALADSGADPNRKSERLEAIQKSVQRGSALVRQLLTFARKTDIEFGSVNLNSVVKEVVELIGATFSKEVVVEADLSPDLPVIKADANQLHQAVLNLCVNARDAMPGGGTITLRTSQIPATDLRDRFAEASAQAYVSLRLSDTGVGMDEETRRRMFDPFFTTKPLGSGQGLGLAVVHGIIQTHRGFADVSSEPGKGTSVQLFFPISQEALERAESSAEATRSTGGTETILLVEDEALLLEPVKTMLEEKGYRVLPARDGFEAVEIYQKNGERIDLVILDMGLPKQGGGETFLRLRSIDPDARILLASGYFDLELKERMLAAGAKAFLRKPYSADEILFHARSVLDKFPSRASRPPDRKSRTAARRGPSPA